MKHVKYHLVAEERVTVSNIDAVNKMLATEQATLDVMRGQVTVNQVQQNNSTPAHTILDALGLSVILMTEAEKEATLQLLGPERKSFRAGFRVINHTRLKALSDYVDQAEDKTVAHLWHGSRNENWWNILKAGLLVRPTNAVITGSMFGYGIYGANKAKKSMGYTSLSGSYWAGGHSHKAYLGIFAFHLGRMYETNRHEGWMSSLDFNKLRRMGGYDSFYARSGYSLHNDEFIVYRPDQVDIWGLVEIG
jgi:poly [ADP-ribose] polymerase